MQKTSADSENKASRTPFSLTRLPKQDRVRANQRFFRSLLEQHLKDRRYLLVFDGIERFLREGDTPGSGIANSPGVRKFLEIISDEASKSVVLLTTRLWPVALSKPAGLLTPNEVVETLDTVAEVPISPITSSDFKVEEPFKDLKGVSELCFLLDGHIYALALAMGVLENVSREKDGRQNCLMQLNIALGRTPPDRRTSRMIREALRAMHKKEDLAISLMDRRIVSPNAI